MALVRHRRVIDLWRMGRHDKLSLRLQFHQAPNHRCVPLWIEVQFRFVDEDEPLAVIV